MSLVLPQEPLQKLPTTTEAQPPLSNGGPLPSLISNGRIIKTQSMRKTPPPPAIPTPLLADSLPELMLPTSIRHQNGGGVVSSAAFTQQLPSIMSIQQPPQQLSQQQQQQQPLTPGVGKMGGGGVSVVKLPGGMVRNMANGGIPMAIDVMNGPRNSVNSDLEFISCSCRK